MADAFEEDKKLFEMLDYGYDGQVDTQEVDRQDLNQSEKIEHFGIGIVWIGYSISQHNK